MSAYSLTKKERDVVWAKTDNKCWYCGRLFKTSGYHKHQRTVEHQTPVCRGGTDDIYNLVPACRSCNSRKNKRTLEEYRVRNAWESRTGLAFTKEQMSWMREAGLNVDDMHTEWFFYGETL